jgi:hypothetical protein
MLDIMTRAMHEHRTPVPSEVLICIQPVAEVKSIVLKGCFVPKYNENIENIDICLTDRHQCALLTKWKGSKLMSTHREAPKEVYLAKKRRHLRAALKKCVWH